MAATVGVGPLVKEWRGRRRRSQLDLALEVGVSARHLSFVETGRSRPSPELVLTLAHHLDVPLRERNALLLAAGYAPRYQETPLDDPAMDQVRSSLTRLLAAHDPYPGVVIDARWDIVLANEAAGLLTAVLPPELAAPPVNVFRACLHPDGLARITRNLEPWATYLLSELHRMAVRSADPGLLELEREVHAYPVIDHLVGSGRWLDDAPTGLLVPVELDLGGQVLALFTTLTSFGTPRDITLAELAVELFYPADAATEAALRGPTG
ncbi:helix-turn-helix domain-containing protein [Aquihabitans sp. McL0605]|uniref:MmyB family transcriptional regulator n=1 Tax=Aquihabitans sp. McL0605 TaxID=3415671 RepID=UPI003CF0A705